MKKKGKPRNIRQARQWRNSLERFRARQRIISRAAPDILASGNFRNMKTYIQHGDMTVNEHVLNVARHSLAIADTLGISCNRRELIRGALLHDYFLYDWHIPDRENPHNLHGIHHPKRALKNALKEYHLTEREKDIIKKHMWPLTLVPPKFTEAWIVSAADKWCSFLETLRLYKGHGATHREA